MRTADKERIVANLGSRNYVGRSWMWKNGAIHTVIAQDYSRVLVRERVTRKTKWIGAESLKRDYTEVK